MRIQIQVEYRLRNLHQRRKRAIHADGNQSVDCQFHKTKPAGSFGSVQSDPIQNRRGSPQQKTSENLKNKLVNQSFKLDLVTKRPLHIRSVTAKNCIEGCTVKV